MKTKYAIFYSSCQIDQFRNGSVKADFTLGFTRYQNATRLNAFFTRTIVNKPLFGGLIVSITLDSSNSTASNDTDYDLDYSSKSLANSWNGKQILTPIDYSFDDE